MAKKIEHTPEQYEEEAKRLLCAKSLWSRGSHSSTIELASRDTEFRLKPLANAVAEEVRKQVAGPLQTIVNVSESVAVISVKNPALSHMRKILGAPETEMVGAATTNGTGKSRKKGPRGWERRVLSEDDQERSSGFEIE